MGSLSQPQLNPLTFFGLNDSAISRTSAGSGVWADWDTSGVIPIGAKSVEVFANNTAAEGSAGIIAGIRSSEGSQDTHSFFLSGQTVVRVLILLGPSRKVAIFESSALTITYTLNGYWT